MKQIYKIVLFIGSLILASGSAQAQAFLKFESIQDSTSFHADSTSTVADPYIHSSYSTFIDSDYAVQNVIALEIKDNEYVHFPDSFSCEVHFVVYEYDINNVMTTVYKTLRVSYNDRNLVKDTLRSYYQFSGKYKVHDSIMSVTVNGITGSPNIFSLTNSIQVQRQYYLLCSSMYITTVDTQYLADQDELLITWSGNITGDSANVFYDEFDLEWTFYDDSSTLIRSGANPYYDINFRNNATRVEVKDNYYQIPLLYEEGWLLYRIRPVVTLPSGQRVPGPWTTDVCSGCTQFKYHIGGHENTINWQAKTSYAEEGKRKSVVSYFDGASKNRQAVTKISSDTISIAAETIYDYEGRPVVNTLPAPTFQKMIQHFGHFNQNYAGQTYSWMDADSITGCFPVSATMNNTTGSSMYYSPSNPRRDISFNQYIPNAWGYPYSQQVYTNDLTGRIRFSAGPGLYHHLGTNHITQYLYAQPDQPELDQLFGHEVGLASHYFKNATIDPNGQVSVTYTDMHGRTIATALSDSTRYASMDPLSEFRYDTITAIILDSTTNFIEGDSIIFTKTFMALTAPTSDYFFKYCLQPPSDSIVTCNNTHFCFDCIYDITITITDDCNNGKMPGGVPFVKVYHDYNPMVTNYFDTLCSNPAPVILDSFYVTSLAPGTYTITKVLSINSNAINYYYNYYLTHDTCIKTFDNFYQQNLSQINLSGCNMTCTQCETELGDSITFVTHYLAGILAQDSVVPLTLGDTLNATASYLQLRAICRALCDSLNLCDQKRIMMLQDMSPTGGQYATYVSTDTPYLAGDRASIFSSNALAFNVSGSPPAHLPIYSDPSIVYMSDLGVPDTIIIDPLNDGNLQSVIPNQLSIQDFVNYWKPSWAEALLPYHPEYCYYQFCEGNSASNDYDNWLLNVSDYDTAVFYGLMNPLNDASGVCPFAAGSHPDPFFQSGGYGAPYLSTIMQKTHVYIDTTGLNDSTIYTLWQIVAGGSNACSPGLSCMACMKNYYWIIFRSTYLGLKAPYVDTAMAAYVGNPANCNRAVPIFNNSSSCLYGKVQRFEPVSDSLWANSNITSPATLEDSAVVVYNADSSGTGFTCKDYASYWWNTLKGCDIPMQDSALVINELIAVCNLGTDTLHIYGASSTGGRLTANGDSTFEMALKWAARVTAPDTGGYVTWSYNHSDSCTSLLITNPMPYGYPILYYNGAAVKPPDSCTCSKIMEYYNLYESSGDSASLHINFNTYLYQVFNIITDSSDISLLFNACNGSTCKVLPRPVVLPYEFSCNRQCVTCAEVDSAYKMFLDSFHISITTSPNFMSLVQSWMNDQLGFNITAGEYFAFMQDSCGYNAFPVDSSAPATPNCPAPTANTFSTTISGNCSHAITGLTGSCGGNCTIGIIKTKTGSATASGGNISYQPGATGNDTVEYRVCNNCNTCDTAFIFISVPSFAACNNAPVLINHNYYICIGDSQTFLPLQGGYDPDNNQLTLAGFSIDTLGLITQNGNDFVYHARVTACKDTFKYIVCDNGSPVACDTAVIYMTINDCSGEPHPEMSVRRLQQSFHSAYADSKKNKLQKNTALSAQANYGVNVPFFRKHGIYANLEPTQVSLPKGVDYGRLFSLNRKVSTRYVNRGAQKPWAGHTLFGATVSATDMNLPPYIRSKSSGFVKLPAKRFFPEDPIWLSFYKRAHQVILDSSKGNSARDIMLTNALAGKSITGSAESRQQIIRYFETSKDVRAHAIAAMLKQPNQSKGQSLNEQKIRDKYSVARAAGLQALANTERARAQLNAIKARTLQNGIGIKGSSGLIENTSSTKSANGPSAMTGHLMHSSLAPTIAFVFMQRHPGVQFPSTASKYKPNTERFGAYDNFCDSLRAAIINYDSLGTTFAGMNNLLDLLNDSLGIAADFPFWKMKMDSCGIACPAIINCTAVQSTMMDFESKFPALTEHCNAGVWTTYFNSAGLTDISGAGANYTTAEWEAVMSCCSVTYPTPDSPDNYCDTISSIMLMCNSNQAATMECLATQFNQFIGGGYYDSITGMNSDITYWLRQINSCGIHTSDFLPCSTFDSLMNAFKTSNPAFADSCPVNLWVNYMNAYAESATPNAFYTANDWMAMLNYCVIAYPKPDTAGLCSLVSAAVAQYDSLVANGSVASLYSFENVMSSVFGTPYNDDDYYFGLLDSCHITCPNIINCSYADSLLTAFISQNPEFADTLPDFIWAGYLNANMAGNSNGTGGYFYYTAPQWRHLLHCCGFSLPAKDSVATFCDSLNDVITYYNYQAGQNSNNQRAYEFEYVIGSSFAWNYTADNGITYSNTNDSFWLAQAAACHLPCPQIINCHLADSLLTVLDSITNDTCPVWVWVDYLNSSALGNSETYDSAHYIMYLNCCGIPMPVNSNLPTLCDTMAIVNSLLSDYAGYVAYVLDTNCASAWLWNLDVIINDNFLAPLGPVSVLCPQLAACGYSCVDTCVFHTYCDSLRNFYNVINIITAGASDGQADTMIVNAYYQIFNTNLDFSGIAINLYNCGIVDPCTDFAGITDYVNPVFAWYDSACMPPAIHALALDMATGLTFPDSLWLHIGEGCGWIVPPLCYDSLRNLCDTMNAIYGLYQALANANEANPDSTHFLGKALSIMLGYPVTGPYADSLLAACGPNPCAGTITFEDSLTLFINPDTCYPAWLYTLAWSQVITVPDSGELSFSALCDTLTRCGLSCPSTCGGLGGTHCDTVAILYALYHTMVNANPTIDSLKYAKLLIKQVMGLHVSNDLAAYDSLLNMYNNCLQIPCSTIDSLEPGLYNLQLLYPNDSIPGTVFTDLLNYNFGVQLTTAQWFSRLIACGIDTFHVSTTPPATFCDSATTAFQLFQLLGARRGADVDTNLALAFNMAFGYYPYTSYYSGNQAIGILINCMPGAICQFTNDYIYIPYVADTFLAGIGTNIHSLTTSTQSSLYAFLDSTFGVSGIDWCDSFTQTCTGADSHYHCAFAATPVVEKYLCNRPLFPPVISYTDDSCINALQQYAYQNASMQYQDYIQDVRDSFVDQYVTKCLTAYKLEHMLYKHPESEFHYTLYYYDQAGNLVQTVPPNGAIPNVFPHTYLTKYRYNTTNQVVEQQTPDAGVSLFWYDRILKLTFSQNAKQNTLNQMSYTCYDPLQRITEVGRLDSLPYASYFYQIFDTIAQDSNWYAHFLQQGHQPKEVTHTYYDDDQLGIAPHFGATGMTNLRNRVASVTYTDTLHTDSTLYNTATHYSYDVDGNVQTLLQEIRRLKIMGQDFKRLDYQFDLISGKVNNVMYQRGQPDAFYHHYEYDADNRITDVYTSRDSTFFDHDAFYDYYLHGPLARAIIGEKQIQAVNYAYTIQGWLKGVNGDKPGKQLMGKDGGPNSLVADDMYGFSLGYFTGDYSPIGNLSSGQQPFSTDAQMHCWDLFNGNISRMKVFNYGLDGLPNGTMDTTMAYRYRYDQLNRLVGMDAQVGIYNFSDSMLHYTTMPDYGEHVTYDPNGNILSYFRNGTTANGGPLGMDSLSYKYQPGNNKLDHVNDAVPATNYIVDIDNQDTLNYRYDQIGNLTKDTSAGIDSIYWTVYGKIWRIVKYNGDTIKFHYGPDGNRIAKEVFVDSLHRWTNTYYIHDAQGNIMATYQWVNCDTFSLDELVMYGSSRLGTLGANIVLSDTALRDSAYFATHDTSTNPFTDSVTYFAAGLKQYEFTNHLGNVLLTLTDRHTPFYLYGVSYLPEIASAQDYYPFGSLMPGRQFTSTAYRYGFNGKEADNEVKGTGNEIDYGVRGYDPRIGRPISVDPKFKSYAYLSPYQFFSNSPIWMIDLDGKEGVVYNISQWKNSSGETQENVSTSYNVNDRTDGVEYRVHNLDNGTMQVRYQPDVVVTDYRDGFHDRLLQKEDDFFGGIGKAVSDNLPSIKKPDVAGIGISGQMSLGLVKITLRVENYSTNENNAGLSYDFNVSYNLTAKNGSIKNDWTKGDGKAGVYFFAKYGNAPTVGSANLYSGRGSVDASASLPLAPDSPLSGKSELSLGADGSQTYRFGVEASTAPATPSVSVGGSEKVVGVQGATPTVGN